MSFRDEDGELDKRELVLQALLRTTEAVAAALNDVGAQPTDFEEGDTIGEFAFEDGSFDTKNDWDMIGGVVYETGRWTAWHQEHE